MSRYQKEDYEMVARIMKDTRIIPSNDTPIQALTLDVVICRFVAEFTNDNPKFEAGKFREAAGYES